MLSRPLSRTVAHRVVIFSTALRHLWLALKDGVKIGDRWVGYAADECRRMTVLEESIYRESSMAKPDSRMECCMKHD